jgi:hypothetical protein
MRKKKDAERRRAGRKRALLIAGAAVAWEAFALRGLGYGFGGKVVVRCGQRHLFTTLWIPGASVKSLRFGMRRFQRCPVGGHWTVVAPVRKSELTPQEQFEASANRDIPIP